MSGGLVRYVRRQMLSSGEVDQSEGLFLNEEQLSVGLFLHPHAQGGSEQLVNYIVGFLD
jgi:hypothetical protein